MSATTSPLSATICSASGATRWKSSPPIHADRAVRVEFFGDEIDRISEINVVTGVPTCRLNHVAIYPASHYVTTHEKMERAVGEIRKELDERVKWFTDNGKLLEAQRIRAADGI
jgi:excinuclease ABC subunit B